MNKKSKFGLINLGLLTVEFLLAFWQYIEANKNPNGMAELVWLFLPVVHLLLSILLGLVFLFMGDKKMAKYFGLLVLAIVLIGFSVCGIMSV